MRAIVLACYSNYMSNAIAPAKTAASISVHDADGAYYMPPTDTVAEGILDGMVDAQTKRGQIVWVYIAPTFAQGYVKITNERVVVADSDLPLDVEEKVLSYLFEG
ncbi:hypothetical protein SEA_SCOOBYDOOBYDOO_103 [Mycobacterium phage ScoobyDoobyDoo]|nr:hypothetical protein SEA_SCOOBYDOOBYDOO_103 [Mycobacterium phage ScoobyDoobyDoo]